MSLLTEIQIAVVDQNTDLPTVLRKCKILAARLGNEQFKRWVENEMNGYKSVDDLPEYRILTVNSYGDFSGSFGSGMKNAPIPLGGISKEYRQGLRHACLLDPISSYVYLTEGQDHDNLSSPWDADVVAHFARNIYGNMNCIAAWKLIPRSSIVAVVDTVRNRVLSFALEIEAEAPDAGEAPVNSQPLPQERVTHIFNTYISGNIQNVAAGSSDFTQVAELAVTENDLASLENYLRSKEIPQGDVERLKQALKEDAAVPDPKPFGNKATEWMAKMLGKAANGTWKVTTEVASSVLSNALAKYYGLQ